MGLIPPSEKTGLHLAGANRNGSRTRERFGACAVPRERGNRKNCAQDARNKPNAGARRAILTKAERRKRILAEKKKDWRKSTAFSELKRDLESKGLKVLDIDVFREQGERYAWIEVIPSETGAENGTD